MTSSEIPVARCERLTTERLVLEPLRVEHAAEMAAVLGDPDLHRFVDGRPLEVEELQERYAARARGRSADGSRRWFNWIIRVRASGRAVGYVQATVDVASAAADVAWVVGSPFQNRGYAREAAAAMVTSLGEVGVSGVTAHIHPDNRASESVARALGFEPTSTVVDGELRWRLPPQGGAAPTGRRERA